MDKTDWADKLGLGHAGQPTSTRLRAEGIQDMLSLDVNCGVIWLHRLGIHIRFFRAHIIVIFLETNTSKAQRASPGDKFWFFGSSQHHVFHVHPNGACHP